MIDVLQCFVESLEHHASSRWIGLSLMLFPMTGYPAAAPELRSRPSASSLQ